MNVSYDVLRKETVQLIREIDTQIGEVRTYADSIGTQAHKLRSSDGWVMPPLLLAKAQAYNTLVLLQVKK